ncbi:MAG: LUD domain-containing protein [Bacteroidales bacterium]|jgi:L-lactate dehydrogenase complex protein LldF|nr:LUD domain-containing protein [Bacteroidales bacterium]
MINSEKNFLNYSQENSLDVDGYENQNQHFIAYERRKKRTRDYYCNVDILYDRASYIRSKGIDNVEKYLKEFETKFTERGGKVIWTVDEREAINAILSIFNSANAKKVIATNSGALREISLKQHLGVKCDFLDTAFPDFMKEITANERFDVTRKNNKEIAQALKERYKVEINYHPNSLTHFIAKQMQSRFFDADIAFTGANFLVADIGAIALSENEGNIARAVAFPKIHIVVAGYDKIIPSVNDLELLWNMFALAGTGEPLTAYNHLIFGPKKPYEHDGPEEMYVVIINNQRDAVLRYRKQRKALNCIRCGACSRYCPVFRTIGKASYQSPYSGPIGSIIVPLMRDTKAYRYLAYASILSPHPEHHCPVRIPLNNLLLYNRALFMKEGKLGEFSVKNVIMQQSLRFLGNRAILNSGRIKKSTYLASIIKNQWGMQRMLPKFAKKSFNETFREKASD